MDLMNKKSKLSKDEVARLLKTTPDALKEFEECYAKAMAAETGRSDNFFDLNSREAVAMAPDTSLISELCGRIAVELTLDTDVYVYDRKRGGRYRMYDAVNSIAPPRVTLEELLAEPESIRPQLSADFMKVDVDRESSSALLFYYKKMVEEKNSRKAREHYNHFRQGLDILDLDPIIYQMIGMNQNSIGYWFPYLVEAWEDCGSKFFRIPETIIARVPMPLLQLTRLDYESINGSTRKIVDDWAKRVFKLAPDKEYFIKTGTYSSKFDFRNAHVHGAQEVAELGEYLLFIHFQALLMASPLSTPTIYGVSTTNEWCVREFIFDKEHNPCIYKGLPLHTEYRIFIDCDTKRVLAAAPYWESETMKHRFGHGEDANSPHQIHDYVIYKAHEDTLMSRYHKNVDKVVSEVQKLLPELGLTGQWSLDVMQNGDEFWLIDMARAENSAFYDYVPKELRRPMKENWIPQID